MEKICFDILNKWAEYINYDEKQTKFNLLSYEYESHKTTKKFKHIIDDYDQTGLLAVVMAKELFLKMLKNSRCSLLDVLEKSQEINHHKEMYDLFFSKELQAAEEKYTESIKAIILKIIGKNLIGEFDDKEFYQQIITFTNDTIKELDKCRIEVYKKGGKIQNITKFSTKIHIFPSLANCILTLNNAEDGIYLCFIDIAHSADSYFGFFIKSNGNLFSVNERISEAYRGAHFHSRNGRWAENKADILFPYDYIFHYDNYDYKGYSHTYNIDEDKLAFFELTEKVYLPLTIAMILLNNKFNGQELKQNPVFIDSLLEINKENLRVEDKNELSLLNQNELVIQNNKLDLTFDMSKIMDGSAVEEFVENLPNGTKYNYISSSNNGQIFVDLYGQGFQYTPNFFNTQKLLTDNEYEYVPEFVGSEKKFRAQAYKELREQLADYLNTKIYEEYKRFGGLPAVKEWMLNQINKNIDRLKDIMVQYFVSIHQGETPNRAGWVKSGESYTVYLLEKTSYVSIYDYGTYVTPNKDARKDKYDDYKYFDLENNNICNMFFVIKPRDYLALEQLFKCEVPKIVKGWCANGHRRSGNSILNMTDAVESVGTPFEYDVSRRKEYEKDYCDFKFGIVIGFSRRSFKALCKSKGVDMSYFKKDNTVQAR